MKVIPFPKTAKATGEGDSRERLKVAIAPRANARIRFAPVGNPTMPAMSPEEALSLVERVIDGGAKILAVDIAGPGEPLATPDTTVDCLRRLHRHYPELDLGLISNGMGGAQIAKVLAASGLQRIALAVDAVTTGTAEKLYAWVRPGTRTVPLAQAVVTLLNEQAAAVAAFSKAGVTVRIVTTVYPGINDFEVEELAQKMAALGAGAISVIPYRPIGGDIDCLEAPDPETMKRLTAGAGKHLPVVAEAPGDEEGSEGGGAVPEFSLPMPTAARPNVAVTSESGMEIDQHLGQASRLLIYGPREDGLVCLLGTRPTPASGSGVERWEALATIVPDCFALLTASAGENPRATLGRLGIPVMITDGDIAGTVDVLYGGGKKRKKGRS